MLEADPDFKLTTGYTYSGHQTACTAALTNIDIIEREGLCEQAILIGERLGAGLRALADDGSIAGVRGDGAVWAAAMHPGQDAQAVRERVLANGVIVRAIADHSVTFCPPLVITDAEVDRVIDAVAAAVTT